MVRTVSTAVSLIVIGLVSACQTGSDLPPSCRIGVLTNEGATCQALRDDQGTLYTFYTDMTGYNLGDEVCLCGPQAQMSFCAQGTVVDVTYLGRTCPK
ncbi:MAG: hypothetical protein CMM78_10325 [Rhodospirillaceae bacterium]|jgi:hypothetical protein|uniref:hypothetical protein n=1 Tax=Hwanghaeella sp. 1Z406 TaxID=3402811 RepID=UPI000C5CA95D|nr:hypothetical protein [Rhodospirillales bacterium]MAX48592.1 hypothetical protein [Rhodospirillaceae bacterium]